MVQAQPDLEVLETAADGAGLLRALERQQPDAIIANFDFPEKEQTQVFREISLRFKMPFLVILEPQQQITEVEANLNRPAVYDFIQQPAYRFRPQLRTLEPEIIDKLRAVIEKKAVQFFYKNPTVFAPEVTLLDTSKAPASMVVLGASTGGTQAIEKLVAGLHPDLNTCILIAVHLPARFTKSFARRLQFHTKLRVVEARTGTRILNGKIIIAPGGENMVVTPVLGETKSLRVAFEPGKANDFDLPSINMLMQSVACHSSGKAMGIILTGMGEDGAAGLQAIRMAGGETLVQDEASCLVSGMAKAALKRGGVGEIIDLADIPDRINKFAAGSMVSDKLNSITV